MADKKYAPIKKAVFPVAGSGTRFLPVTKVMPKEMLPINDRPLIQHVYEEAHDAGIEEFIFVTGRHKNMLEEHFDFQPELQETLESKGRHDLLQHVLDSEIPAGQLFLTRQPKPLGLGHAIWCAKKLIGDEPFAVLLPDVLIKSTKGCLSQMIEIYNKTGGNIISVEDVPESEINKYGIIAPGEKQNGVIEIKGLVEKPEPKDAPSSLSVTGRYILQPEVFDHLDKFERGTGNEIQLTDAMAKLIGKQPFHGLQFKGKSYDCGSRLGFIKANIAYAIDDTEIGDDINQFIKNLGA